MNIRVLFFGATADETGSRVVDLDVDENSKGQTAFDDVLHRYPQLRKHRLLFAVNQEYVPGDRQLNDGDELAIFTAVSGG